jgi:hypothetical protein
MRFVWSCDPDEVRSISRRVIVAAEGEQRLFDRDGGSSE